MARRPTLSPSKLTCYLACPHKYYWTYESAHGQWFLKSHSYFSFGLSLHRALETFHRNAGAGVDVREALLGALDENWIQSGYGSADEMQAAFGEAKAILGGIADDLEESRSEGVDLGVRVLFIEKSLRKSMGEWDLIGRADRIDLIDSIETPVVNIVDYKSSRAGILAEEVANDVAMSSYALMVRDLFPGHQIRATIHALQSKETAHFDWTDEGLDEFEFSVRELGEAIRNHHWDEFHPVPKRLCATCDFVSLCRKSPHYRELLEQAENVINT